MNTESKFQTLITAALLTALTCIATMIIKVPTIGTSGYINIGDTMVLTSCWLLGNPYGALAAGLGSALADLLSGYASYVPGTFAVKFAMAFVGYLIVKILKKTSLPLIFAYIISGVLAEIIMVVGYFLYESTLMGYGIGAAASIPSNIIQGLTCLVLGVALILALTKVPYFKQMINR